MVKMENKKLHKFGIIGCGHIAQRHAEHIRNNGQLQAVCDINYERAKALGEKYGIKYYTNYDQMLNEEKDIEIIAVCTPNGLHAEHSIKAMRAGKHVLCEKPMAISVIDAENMIYESEKTNRRLFIVKQNRYNPPIVRMKEIINDGVLGKILNVQLNCFWNRNENYYNKSDWKGKKDLDGGILFTQFSHFIDIMYWLIGDVKKAYGLKNNFIHQNVVEFEDSGAAIFEFYNGAIGSINFTINSWGSNMEGSITIFGEKGTVKVGGQYLNVFDYQSIDGYKIEGIEEGKKANDYGFYQGSMSNHDKVYENLINTLDNNEVIATNGIEGMKVVQIIEKIYNSAKRNGRDYD
ncbi:MAG: oxidoreductase [Melioribacteraceae bacterium]|nr:MAG: oxidoreductase [Melioribacteraceae bacterium]